MDSRFSPLAWIARLARRLAAERTRRRAIRELEAMSELELRDLAICRDDISRVVLQGRGSGTGHSPAR